MRKLGESRLLQELCVQTAEEAASRSALLDDLRGEAEAALRVRPLLPRGQFFGERAQARNAGAWRRLFGQADCLEQHRLTRRLRRSGVDLTQREHGDSV